MAAIEIGISYSYQPKAGNELVYGEKWIAFLLASKSGWADPSVILRVTAHLEACLKHYPYGQS